jgi:hypothetical protein
MGSAFMRKAIVIVPLLLTPLICGWPQACPSSNNLRPEPPVFCSQRYKVGPKGWQKGASVTVYLVYNSYGTFSDAQKAAIRRAYQN